MYYTVHQYSRRIYEKNFWISINTFNKIWGTDDVNNHINPYNSLSVLYTTFNRDRKQYILNMDYGYCKGYNEDPESSPFPCKN